MASVEKWMELEIIVLSERSQTKINLKREREGGERVGWANEHALDPLWLTVSFTPFQGKKRKTEAFEAQSPSHLISHNSMDFSNCNISFTIFYFIFEAKSAVDQAGLELPDPELLIPLPLPPKHWNHRHLPSHLGQPTCKMQPRLPCRSQQYSKGLECIRPGVLQLQEQSMHDYKQIKCIPFYSWNFLYTSLSSAVQNIFFYFL